MPTYGKLNILIMNNIYSVFFSVEIQRRLVQTKLYFQFFTLCLKRNISQTSKVAAAKNFFPSVYMLLVKLASMNVFIPCDDLKNYFLKKFIFYPEHFCNRDVVEFFETIVLKEVRILYPLSLQ